MELRVVGAVPDVVSDWQHLERVALVSLVELAHVVEKGILIRQMIVVLKLRIHLEAIGCVLFLIFLLCPRVGVVLLIWLAILAILTSFDLRLLLLMILLLIILISNLLVFLLIFYYLFFFEWL